MGILSDLVQSNFRGIMETHSVSVSTQSCIEIDSRDCMGVAEKESTVS